MHYLLSFLFSLPIGMGVGGGGLFLLYLTAFRFVPQKEAQLLNLLLYLSAVCASLILHFKNRRIFLKAWIQLSPFGLTGAFLGSLLAFHLHSIALSLLFSLFMVLSGIFTLIKK